MSLPNIPLPRIPEEARTPLVLELMDNQGLPKSIRHSLNNHPKKEFADLAEWDAHLKELKIVNHRHIQIATEGALIGSLLYHGLPKYLVIVSDDAGQFNILNHALCWIHAERTLHKLIAPNEEKRQILESVRKQVWDFYDDLKAYKSSPDQAKKSELEKRISIHTYSRNLPKAQIQVSWHIQNDGSLPVPIPELFEMLLSQGLSRSDARNPRLITQRAVE